MRSGKTVLMIVNADEAVREADADLLRESHYEILGMHDGKAALDYLQENPYIVDVILAEMEAPVIDGIDFLRLLKLSQRMKDVPVVIVIDAEKYEADMEKEIMENGAEDILLRPFDQRIWVNRISNIVNANKHLRCINIMEEVVEKQLDKCTETLGLCKCRICQTDVLTLALNHLTPRYVSSEKGRLLAVIEQMSYDYLPEILRAITEAAEIVKKNPNHPPIK